MAISSGRKGFLARHAALYFIPQVFPDGARNINKGLVVANLADQPRPWQVNRVNRFHGSRPGRQPIHLVGQRNRFFKIMGDENNGGLGLG
jgi:hypothetical protein